MANHIGWPQLFRCERDCPDAVTEAEDDQFGFCRLRFARLFLRWPALFMFLLVVVQARSNGCSLTSLFFPFYSP